jgi:hypothetical protein
MWVGQPGREPVDGEGKERERGRQALLSCLSVSVSGGGRGVMISKQVDG